MVLDIPLLFETKGDKRVDTVVVVSAPRSIQIHRVAQRRRMSKDDVEAVIARQMPDAEKRRRADVVIRTGLSRNHTLAQSAPLHPGTARMIRTVLFDTETTGLDPLNGDRVIEVAALELINDLPTGKHFHALIDPQRDIPADASRIHGFTNGDLVGKPLFADIAAELLAFFADSKLIAHNAPFDFGFLEWSSTGRACRRWAATG